MLYTTSITLSIPIMALLTLVSLILIYVLFSRTTKLEHKITYLEAKLEDKNIERKITTSTLVEDEQRSLASDANTNRTREEILEKKVGVVEEERSHTEGSFSEWIREDVLLKLGSGLLLLALAWFLRYAIVSGWIGPVGQIFTGLLISTLCMVLGALRIGMYARQGSVFILLGSTGVLLTMNAARMLYHLFTPLSALFMCVLAIVFVATVSVRKRRESLALASLILSAFAPFLVASTPAFLEIMGYLVVVVLGTFGAVYLMEWYRILFGAHVLVWVYSSIYFSKTLFRDGSEIILFFAFLFTTIFFIANIVTWMRNETRSIAKWHIGVGAGTGAYLALWVLVAAPHEIAYIFYLIWALMFSVGGFVMYCVIEDKTPFYLFGGVGASLIAFATASTLTGSLLTLSFTFETVLLVYLAGKVLRSLRIATFMSALFAIPIVLSLQDFVLLPTETSIFNIHFSTILTMLVAFVLSGLVLRDVKSQVRDVKNNTWKTLCGMGGVYALGLFWVTLEALIQNDQIAHMISLVVFTTLGLAAYLSGHFHERDIERKCGIALLSFVIVHLFLVEMHDMDSGGRIITFFVVGLLFVSTAFVRTKKLRKAAFIGTIKKSDLI